MIKIYERQEEILQRVKNMQEENIRLKTQMNVATYTEKIKVPVGIKVLLIVNKIIMEISNCA